MFNHKQDNNDKIKMLKLNNEQLDVLKEIGNIGSGHAVTALSNLLNKNIMMTLTDVNIVPFWQLPNLIADPFSQIFGINSEIVNNSNLSILQFFSKESMLRLINILKEEDDLKEEKITKIDDLDEYTLSIITETGNILAGHYASALSDFISITLIPDVPHVALDFINAIITCVTVKFSQITDYIVLIHTKLSIGDLNLDGVLCFIPSLNILNKFFKSLNIECLF